VSFGGKSKKRGTSKREKVKEKEEREIIRENFEVKG
jgi:hypothetical protein